jgi:protein-tyrosine phosphatase
MGLDYTDGCVNFRDLGEYISLIHGQDILPISKILRVAV